MIRRPPRSTRTDTLLPYTTLFRSRIPEMKARLVADANEHLDIATLAPTFDVDCELPLEEIDRRALQWLGLLGPHGVGNDSPKFLARNVEVRSEEHTSELQSLMRISYAVFCLKQKKTMIYTQTDNCETLANIMNSIT